MKVFEIALSSILGATLGVAITYVALDSRLDSIEKEVSLMTPVAVVDFLSIANSSPSKGLTDTEMKRRIDALESRSKKLADQGFVVLRHEKLYSAPEGIVIKHTRED